MGLFSFFKKQSKGNVANQNLADDSIDVDADSQADEIDSDNDGTPDSEETE